MLALLLTFYSCSPLYVMRAGWEEAGILMRREKISKLIEEPETKTELKRKLQLVLDARKFSESIGLKPKGSFTQYSTVDRDVLVWVLSASEKLSFTPVTWWFPIVGRIPYKGFFEKKDGLKALRKLTQKGYDASLRPSPAFSTLGWFNDPLLSTMIDHDDVALVNTVIHEVLHNTIWIPDHANFNETLANVVGAQGAIRFFESSASTSLALSKEETIQLARDRMHDERIYARYLGICVKKLKKFYNSLSERDRKEEELKKIALKKRKALFNSLAELWESFSKEARTEGYKRPISGLNNARIIAQHIYQDRPEIIYSLFKSCDKSFSCFLNELQAIKKGVVDDGKDPYDLAKVRVKELRSAKVKGHAASIN